MGLLLQSQESHRQRTAPMLAGDAQFPRGADPMTASVAKDGSRSRSSSPARVLQRSSSNTGLPDYGGQPTPPTLRLYLAIGVVPRAHQVRGLRRRQVPMRLPLQV